MANYGATPEDWERWVDLGYGPDLLPVVSNPNAVISPHSRMKSLGKTPSLYDGEGRVVGIPKWTEMQATPNQVRAWSQNPDLGICVQTRRIKAIDIDVDDVELATKYAAEIEDHIRFGSRFASRYTGRELPVRWRENSGKRLMVLMVNVSVPKSVVHVKGGMVEFLGHGQQFIANGTHPSGVRYQWS